MQIKRAQADDLVVSHLPDGSRIVLDRSNDKVLALNATAGAAWDACGDAASLSELTEKMQRTLDAGVSEEMAVAALAELEAQNLIRTSGLPRDDSRRRFLTKAGLAALPLVMALTLSEQKAYAAAAVSPSR